MNIGIVILHYMTDRDTMQCVASFREKLDTKDYKIIIVDNKSDNGSVERLEKVYVESEDVVIIKNSENLGFAKGLNCGIKYAREVLKAKFIVAANNDTELVSNQFFAVLEQKYAQYRFSLLGPMIICGDGVCSVNPIMDRLRDYVEVKKSVDRYKKLLRLNSVYLLNFYLRLAALKKSLSQKTVKPVQLEDKINVKLHGCFWVFSEEYFTKFSGLDEGTFLYMEEDIVFLHLMRNGLKSMYTPDVVVYHKEYSSTSEKFKNTREKQNFIYTHCVNSQNYYLELWNKYSEK